jgi:hypothetical protein
MEKKEVDMINGLGISLILISIIFLIWFLAYILFSINKKKGAFSFILSLLFTSFSVYYISIASYTNKFLETAEKNEKVEKIILEPKIEQTIVESKIEQTKKPESIALVFQINGKNIKVGINEEIEIKKSSTFIISDIEGIDKEDLKVNLVGFVGDPKHNEGNDIGYKINYKEMWKNKEIDKDKYKIEIKKSNKEIGCVFIKFID